MPIEMIDISDKPVIERLAIAEGTIKLGANSIKVIKSKKVKKGDVLATSQIAGIQAAKSAHQLIPLCHQIQINSVKIDFKFRAKDIKCICEVKANSKTGVEMDALAGVTVALLNIWDMVKYLEKDENGQYPSTKITNIRVKKKKKN